jgi:hypothetical protein
MDMAFPTWSFYLAQLFPYAAVGWAGYLAWRWVRAYEGRHLRRRDLYVMSTRVRVLEDSVEEFERRMARSEDVHRFTTSVLAGRAALDNRVLADRR